MADKTWTYTAGTGNLDSFTIETDEGSPTYGGSVVSDDFVFAATTFLHKKSPYLSFALRPKTWAERERDAVEAARMVNRLRRLRGRIAERAMAARYRIAHAIYPFEEDGWD